VARTVAADERGANLLSISSCGHRTTLTVTPAIVPILVFPVQSEQKELAYSALWLRRKS